VVPGTLRRPSKQRRHKQIEQHSESPISSQHKNPSED
jgi:hypothetical protein